VNDELSALERGLAQSLALLMAGGRLVAISFHSLEDRIVKRFMAREARGDEAYAGLPNIPAHAQPRLKLVGKLVRPTPAEVERNPRARSARLRVAERARLGQAA
jgi:16S rRNA (cytosine1402-N4)-methyltransferase